LSKALIKINIRFGKLNTSAVK